MPLDVEPLLVVPVVSVVLPVLVISLVEVIVPVVLLDAPVVPVVPVVSLVEVIVPVVLLDEPVVPALLDEPVAIIDDSYDASCETGITTMRGWNMLIMPLVLLELLVPAMPMFMPSKVKMVPDSMPLLAVLPVEPAPIMLTEPFCTVTLGMIDESTSKATPPELMFGPVSGVPAVLPVVPASGVAVPVVELLLASGVASVVASAVASAVASVVALASVGASVAAVPALVVLSAPVDVVPVVLLDGVVPPHAANTTIAPIAIHVRNLKLPLFIFLLAKK